MEINKITEMFKDEDILTEEEQLQKDMLQNFACHNNTKMYNIYDLVPFDANKEIFDLKDIESKADSILRCGLLQMPRVRPIENTKQAHILAGHKRIAALKLLVEQGHPEYRHIRCEVDKRDLLYAEMAMIDTNLEASKLSSFELMQAVGRRAELINQLREKEQLKGKTVDLIAENSNLERTQIGYYLKCYKKLNHVSKVALREQIITFKSAIKLADEDESVQTKIIVLMKSKHLDFEEAFKKANDNIHSTDDLTAKQKELIVKAVKYDHKESISMNTTVDDLKNWMHAFSHSSRSFIDSSTEGWVRSDPKGLIIQPISNLRLKWGLVLQVLKEELSSELGTEKLHVKKLQNRIEDSLATKVSIKPHKIEINYTDTDDLNRILEKMNFLDQSLT